VPWLTPLFHGVELVRGLVLGTLDWAAVPIHLGYLVAMLAIGVILADRYLYRRMAG
jgi:lipooligosaccharide transport system permease protein